jgi:exonuclease III
VTSLRIATWNIAGCRKISSVRRFDYGAKDPAYFASQLATLEPDIVCLQEAETFADRSDAVELAERLGLPVVCESPNILRILTDLKSLAVQC